jgi:predicted PurR-regulated permease PerM
VLIVAVVIAIQIVLLIPTVAIAVVLAVVLAATFRPLVLALIRRGWRRGPAAAASTGGAFLIVISIVLVTAVSLIHQGVEIATTSAAGADTVDDAAGGALGPLVELVKGLGQAEAAGVAQFAAGIASLAVILLLSGLLCFYFLLDGNRFWAAMRDRVPANRAPEIEAAGERAIGVLSGYMVGTGGVSLFGAVTQFVIMVILGLPLALPLAVLAFFGGFIPYIGSFIVTALAFLVAVAVGTRRTS